MEKFITATGKTIDLAIEAALQQLKMDRDSVSVEVLENPIHRKEPFKPTAWAPLMMKRIRSAEPRP